MVDRLGTRGGEEVVLAAVINSVDLDLDLETGATEKVVRTPDDKDIDDLADSTKEVDESLSQVSPRFF